MYKGFSKYFAHIFNSIY